MKNILITGGTDGIGKALAIHFLKKGNKVVVVGNSKEKGVNFVKQMKSSNLFFIQANLSLVSENKRLISEFSEKFDALDTLILCAQNQKITNEYRETKEGIEFIFALYYLSRYILSYGLKELLNKSENPVIFNVCGIGTNNRKIKWDDLQLKNNYGSVKAIMQGNKLHGLTGVSFDQNNKTKIKYVLYNPGIVRTPGTIEAASNSFVRSLMKVLLKFIGQSVDNAIKPILEILNYIPNQSLIAYKQRKTLKLKNYDLDQQNAQKLHRLTEKLIND